MELDMLKEQLGDELYGAVSRRLQGVDNLRIIDTQDGSWIPRSRFDEERRGLKSTQEQLRQLQGEHEEFRKSREAEEKAWKEQVAALRGDVTRRDEQIESLSTSMQERDSCIEGLRGDVKSRDGTIEQLKSGLAERDGQIRTLHLHGKEKELVRKAGARDPEVVFRLLDQDRISVGEDGTVTGLTEQLEEIELAVDGAAALETLKKESGYLFQREHAPRGGWSMPGGQGTESGESTLSGNVNAAIRAAFGR